MKNFTQSLLNVSLAAALTALSGNAVAGGFGLIEQSGSGMGNAFAGGAASAEDASTIYFNPAGMSRLKGKQIAVALHAINPSAKFTPSATATGGALQVAGNNGGDPGGWGYVPNGYFAMEVDPALSFGIGVNAPFGMQTEYDAGWIGRFQAMKSSIKTVNINPSISYRMSDTVTLGAGINYQKIDGELTSATNYSAAAFAAGGAPLLGAIGGAGVEGVTTVKGKDAAWGYNLGVLFNATPQTRVGLAYRSTINYTLNGTVSFTNRPAALAAAIPDGAVNLSIKMPDTFSASAFHQLNDKWDIMADATWTGWSVFKQLKIDRASGVNLTTVPENWSDTWRFAVGANHHYNEQWTARMGLAYDQTPVSDAFRTARIPDQDRTWLSLGGQYKPSKESAIDFGYTHLFMSNATIADNKAATGAGNLAGTYSAIATNIFSVQYTHGF